MTCGLLTRQEILTCNHPIRQKSLHGNPNQLAPISALFSLNFFLPKIFQASSHQYRRPSFLSFSRISSRAILSLSPSSCCVFVLPQKILTVLSSHSRPPLSIAVRLSPATVELHLSINVQLHTQVFMYFLIYLYFKIMNIECKFPKFIFSPCNILTRVLFRQVGHYSRLFSGNYFDQHLRRCSSSGNIYITWIEMEYMHVYICFDKFGIWKNWGLIWRNWCIYACLKKLICMHVYVLIMLA